MQNSPEAQEMKPKAKGNKPPNFFVNCPICGEWYNETHDRRGRRRHEKKAFEWEQLYWPDGDKDDKNCPHFVNRKPGRPLAPGMKEVLANPDYNSMSRKM